MKKHLTKKVGNNQQKVNFLNFHYITKGINCIKLITLFSCIAMSMFFTMALWSSLGEGFVYKAIFSVIGLILESTKFISFVGLKGAALSRNYFRTILLFTVYLVLTLSSVVSSIVQIDGMISKGQFLHEEKVFFVNHNQAEQVLQKRVIENLINSSEKYISYGFISKAQRIMDEKVPEERLKLNRLIEEEKKLYQKNIPSLIILINKACKIYDLNLNKSFCFISIFLGLMVDICSLILLLSPNRFIKKNQFEKNDCVTETTIHYDTLAKKPPINDISTMSDNKSSYLNFEESETNRILKVCETDEYQNIKKFILEGQYPTTLRYLIDNVGINQRRVYKYFSNLQREGVIYKVNNRYVLSNSIRLQ